MTTFPDQLYQLGGVPAGVNRLRDLWNKDNIYFVDGYAGSASNSGLRPDRAFALPSEAISACSGGASIYIRPIGVNYDQSTTTNWQFYTDDIIIPYTKSGIALIGAGEPRPFGYGGAAVRPSSGGYGIEIRSCSNLVENLHCTRNGGTSDSEATIIYLTRGTTSRAYGNVIRGNRFSQDVCTYGSPQGRGAISMYTSQRNIIEDNQFENLCQGIGIGTNINCIIVRRNTFGGATSVRDVDVLLNINSSTTDQNIIIADNMFADGLPALSTGAYKRFMYWNMQTAGTGIVANNYFATTTVSFNEAGSQCKTADNFFWAGNYMESAGASDSDQGVCFND